MKTLLALILCSIAFANQPFKLIYVKDLAELQAKKDIKLAIFDANGEKMRKKEGMIVGAKPLSSSSNYDLAELPADKSTKLVFYCGNLQCTASHTAAERAAENGYSDVMVMADGIMGWKKAKKPVSKL